MSDQPSGPPRAAVLGAVTVLAMFLLLTAALPVPAAAVFSDALQVQLSAVAALACGAHARRCPAGRLRTAWALLAAACASWAAGQGWWTWLTVRGQEPFPSLADAGYLAFAVLAVAALLAYPAEGGSTGLWQRICDAVMTCAAVGLLSWETTLGAVVAADAVHAGPAGALLVTYPVADVVLVVLVILMLSRTDGNRTALTLLGRGLVCLAVADSVFTYLATTSAYDGGAVDVGWVAAFVLIGLAAWCGAGRYRTSLPPDPAAVPALPVQLLPYLPVAAALALALGDTLVGGPLARGEVVVVAVMIVLLLARQFTVMRANYALVADVAAREGQLRHQAFHDPLTGLPNRALFHDRLSHAVARHARDRRPVAVVFCDLDDFKPVNDTFGHAAGDQLLIAVAARLTGAVRGEDTVGRLGGDEFAVLLEDGGDPAITAGRLAAALTAPLPVAGTLVRVHASIGVGHTDPGESAVTVDELLARADAAMYAAKRDRKHRPDRGRDHALAVR